MKIFYTLIFIILNLHPAFAQWENVSPTPDVNIHHAIGFSYLDKGYIVTGAEDTSTVIGSGKFYEYNSLTDIWTRKTDFPGPLRSYGIGEFYNGKMYLGFGGNFAGSFNLFNDLWSYDPETDIWEELAECPCDGRFHPSFNILNGKIYTGLGSSTGDLEDFWEYDIAENSWTQKANFLGGKRHHPYHFVLGEYIYVGFGHSHVDHVVNKDWFRYDPSSDTWLQMGDLPAQGRVAGTQFTHNGFGYALSGQGENLENGFHHGMEEGELWQYTPASDSWEQFPSHPGKSRFAPASFVVNGYVYLIAGVYSDGNGENQVMRLKLEDDISISVENKTPNEAINIHPNPFKELIHLDFPESIDLPLTIDISNLNGQILFSKTVHQREVKITPEHLDKGIYFLRVKTNEKTETIKIIRN